MAVKTTKKAASIDMTAMCDVAFLLLTFFILTATAKVPEPMPVDTPSSTVQTKIPESNLAIITIGKDKVFFNIKGRDVRIQALEQMGEKYGFSFTDKEKNTFALLDDFGVPINQISSLVALSSTDRNKPDVQTGIPKDSLDNQLSDWIRMGRQANIDINKQELVIAIKGDAKEQYPEIKKVMDILQDQGVNNFNLVTGLRKLERDKK